MKHIYFVIILVMSNYFLTSCGGNTANPDDNRMTIEAVAEKIEWNKSLSEHMLYADAERIAKAEDNVIGVDWYKISATVSDDFDDLSPEEQYEYVLKVQEVVREYDDAERFACRDGARCMIQHVVVETTYHEYSTQYNSDDPGKPLEVDDDVVYRPEVEEQEEIEEETDEEIADEGNEEESVAGLSPEFKEYNERFYTAFKNSLDLIGSNFELIVLDLYSQDLIEDLITWTKEFNEVLDVYEQDAHPENEADQELYAKTNQMIEAQRKANASILEGLQGNNPHAPSSAGHYLEESTALYLEGDGMLGE